MMPALLAIVLSIAIPWLLGAACIHAFTRRSPFGGLLAIGYGYLPGALAATLVLRAESLVHLPWTLAGVALPVAGLALAATWLQRGSDWRTRGREARAAFSALPFALRLLFAVALALVLIRAVGLALEVMWRPVQPWDAWSHWGTKARVWFEYRRMVPFVSPGAWLAHPEVLAFTDQQPAYPGTVPLLQVWTCLWLGAWDDAAMNAPWVAAYVSLGIAAYAQARRVGIGAAAAMTFTWLLVSLPFLDVHVALAGMADLFLAAAFGMSAMAMALAVRTRRSSDIALAVLLAVVSASVKVEGTLWVLTLLPGVLVAWRPRLGLRVVAIGAAIAVTYLVFGPERLRLFGYTLQTGFTNVSLPLFQHMFLMDNWHLFWYAAFACVLWRWRRLLDPALAPMTIAMLGASAFVVVVFFFSNAAGGVDDETLVNRLLLHVVPALGFYLLLLVDPRPQEGPATASPLAGPASS